MKTTTGKNTTHLRVTIDADNAHLVDAIAPLIGKSKADILNEALAAYFRRSSVKQVIDHHRLKETLPSAQAVAVA